MDTQYESVLTCRDKNGKLIGFWCNEIKERHITLFLCKTASLDDIKDLMNNEQKEQK